MLRSRLSPAALLLPLILAACSGPAEAPPPVAALAASEAAPVSSGDLAGTSWEALTLGGAPVTSSPAPTLAFLPDGRVSASGGCNRLQGAVAVDGASIRFPGPFAATKRACPGDLEARDARMIEVLQSAATHAVAGGRLTLFDAAGTPVMLLLPALEG